MAEFMEEDPETYACAWEGACALSLGERIVGTVVLGAAIVALPFVEAAVTAVAVDVVLPAASAAATKVVAAATTTALAGRDAVYRGVAWCESTPACARPFNWFRGVSNTGAEDDASNTEGGIVATETGSAAINTGDVAVYTSTNAAGDVGYVGITNNLTRRGAEQLADKGIRINPVQGLTNLVRGDARAVEQVLIEEYGGPMGGQLLNKINSIATGNPAYAQAIQRGCEILATVGYAAASGVC